LVAGTKPNHQIGAGPKQIIGGQDYGTRTSIPGIHSRSFEIHSRCGLAATRQLTRKVIEITQAFCPSDGFVGQTYLYCGSFVARTEPVEDRVHNEGGDITAGGLRIKGEHKYLWGVLPSARRRAALYSQARVASAAGRAWSVVRGNYRRLMR
jgi:hypothetical protein